MTLKEYPADKKVDRHQGDPRDHRPGPEGSQGPGRGRALASRKASTRPSRDDEEEARGSRREGRDQVRPPCAVARLRLGCASRQYGGRGCVCLIVDADDAPDFFCARRLEAPAEPEVTTMAYSFTEKKRIRKNFGKQAEHPRDALPAGHPAGFLPQVPAGGQAPKSKRDEIGLHAAFKSVFPISSYSRQRLARVRELPPRRAGVRRQGVPAARPDLCRAAAREGAPDRARQGSRRRQEAGQGRARAGGLPRRAAAHDRQRHLRHQRHRARHRLAAAPLARACSSITTAARPIPRASCCSRRASFPTAAPGSTSSSTRRTACSRVSTAAASCR